METNQANEIMIYQPDDTLALDVRVEDESVWLNRHQIAELFGRDVKTIGKHIGNALKEELEGMAVVANFATTAADGLLPHGGDYRLGATGRIVNFF